MTRDSATLRIILLASILAGIIAQTVTPEKFGVTDVFTHWVGLAAQLLSAAAAYLSSSPLPSKAEKIATEYISDPTRFRD